VIGNFDASKEFIPIIAFRLEGVNGND